MWLIDCKDFEAAAGNVMLQNQTTKLRPLMPRSIPPPPNPHYFSPTFPPWNQSPSFMADYGVRREMATLPLVSSRWNPTPEQLQALEEMYRRGVRTPSAEQIQQIAARLRRFGKIEGKNVFYWFQNHKARERQRKRRHEMELLAGKKLRHVDTNSEQRRPPGMSRSCYMEVENPKKLTTSNNTTHSELYYGLDNEELQQQAMAAKQGGTESSCCYCWQQLELSSSYMSPNHSMDKFDGPGIAAAAKPFVVQESQTLELFPAKACEEEEEEEGDYIDMGRGMPVLRPHNHHHHHHQFFEFLPTKDC